VARWLLGLRPTHLQEIGTTKKVCTSTKEDRYRVRFRYRYR